MSDHKPASVIAIGAVMPTVGALAVALRFHVRRKYRQSMLVDDWILIPAAVCSYFATSFGLRLTDRIGSCSRLEWERA